MEQKGWVRRLEDDRVWVEINCGTSCSDQAAKPGAAPGSPVCCGGATLLIEARRPAGLRLEPGQAVTLEQPGPGLGILALLFFVVPVAGLLLGLLLPRLLGAAAGPADVLAGLGGLALGCLVPFAWTRGRSGRLAGQPPMVRDPSAGP